LPKRLSAWPARSTGALIVVVRRNAVAELVSGGIVLEAGVSPEILEAIFKRLRRCTTAP
jgi:DNA integrity scanning protein DisA with diadenylate cyclase activity